MWFSCWFPFKTTKQRVPSKRTCHPCLLARAQTVFNTDSSHSQLSAPRNVQSGATWLWVPSSIGGGSEKGATQNGLPWQVATCGPIPGGLVWPVCMCRCKIRSVMEQQGSTIIWHKEQALSLSNPVYQCQPNSSRDSFLLNVDSGRNASGN